MVGLASTGLVAAAVFYFTKNYIVKDWSLSQPILL
jgi:hypothetical protein